MGFGGDGVGGCEGEEPVGEDVGALGAGVAVEAGWGGGAGAAVGGAGYEDVGRWVRVVGVVVGAGVEVGGVGGWVGGEVEVRLAVRVSEGDLGAAVELCAVGCGGGEGAVVVEDAGFSSDALEERLEQAEGGGRPDFGAGEGGWDRLVVFRDLQGAVIWLVVPVAEGGVEIVAVGKGRAADVFGVVTAEVEVVIVDAHCCFFSGSCSSLVKGELS